MIEFLATEEFLRRYQELPKPVQKKAEKQEQFFRQNPFYPSLHTEKLQPKTQQVWSFRIDKEYRILFRFLTPPKGSFVNMWAPHMDLSFLKSTSAALHMYAGITKNL